MKYPKINTLFNRDRENSNVIIPSQISKPEFDYLKDLKWECTEKIDGTNIRVYLNYYLKSEETVGCDITFMGRSDNAQIPSHLINKLNKLFTEESALDYFKYHFGNEISENLPTLVLHGEGYGYKIQVGANYLGNEVSFILFDVSINTKFLPRGNVEIISKFFDIKVVPLIGYMTIPEAIEYVKKGFKSTIAVNKDYDAEGLILKTPYGLCDSQGNRIITKLKTCDFIKLQQNIEKNGKKSK